MVNLLLKDHSMKDVLLSKLVRILNTVAAQMEFLQQRVLKTKDVQNHNAQKPYSDAAQINILQQKGKMRKVVQFQLLFHQQPRRKLILRLYQLRVDLGMMTALINLLKNLVLSMNSDVVQMVRRLPRDQTSRAVMKSLMKKIAVTPFMDAVMTVKLLPPHQIKKIALHVLRNRLDAVLMVVRQLMDTIAKDAVLFMNMDVAQITSALLGDLTMKVVIVIIHLMDAALIRKQLLVVMKTLDVDVNKLNLDAALTNLLQHLETTLKDAHAIPCNSDVAQMASQSPVDLIITDVIVLKLNISVALMIKLPLKDQTLKDVLALKVNLAVAKMVFLKLKETNSKVVWKSRKSLKKPAHYKLTKANVKTIQSNITSTTTTEIATGSGTVDVEETETNSTPTKNANKPVLSMLARKLVCYRKVQDHAMATNKDSISMLITTDVRSSSMEDATEILTTSRLYKNVKAYAHLNNLHVSILLFYMYLLYTELKLHLIK